MNNLIIFEKINRTLLSHSVLHNETSNKLEKMLKEIEDIKDEILKLKPIVSENLSDNKSEISSDVIKEDIDTSHNSQSLQVKLQEKKKKKYIRKSKKNVVELNVDETI